MTDYTTRLPMLMAELQSESELLLGLIGHDHQRAGAAVVNKLNKLYSELSTIKAQEAAERAVAEWLERAQAKPEDLPG